MAVTVRRKTAETTSARPARKPGGDGRQIDFESYCKEVFNPVAAFTKHTAVLDLMVLVAATTALSDMRRFWQATAAWVASTWS